MNAERRARWASSSGDVLAVGGAWRPEFVPGGRPMPLFAVAGDATRVTLVGFGLEFRQRDSTGWALPAMPPRSATFTGRSNLAALWGTGTGTLWTVGAGGAVWRFTPSRRLKPLLRPK